LEDTIHYINSFIEGNNEAFEKIVIKYEKLVNSFISGKVPEKDVDDVVQETFIKVFINCAKLKNPASFKAWLFAICRNCINNYLRDKNNKSEEILLIEDLPAKVEIQKDENPILIIEQAIHQMPLQKQSNLKLKYLCGFSYKEIASLKGISENLVKSRLFEYRKILKQIIENHQQNLVSFPLKDIKECIMEKIDNIKKGAEIITGLSLNHQVKLCGFVKENKKFDADLLEGIGNLNGGEEFVATFNGKISFSEFADLLCFIHKDTVERIITNYTNSDVNFANQLNREITLSDLKVSDNKAFFLKSEKITDDPDSIIIALSGYIDNTIVAGEFEKKMLTLIESGYVNIILNCDGLHYISSVGFGALIVILKEIAVVKGNLILCNLMPIFGEIFSLLGLSHYVVKVDAIEQALEYCSKSDRKQVIIKEKKSDLIHLMPENNSGDNNLNFYSYYRNSVEPSYNYYDYKKMENNKWAVIRAQIAGKGSESAAISSQISSSFHLFFEHNSDRLALNEVLYFINSQILDLKFHNRFAVLIIMIVDGNTGETSICTAGDHHIPFYNAAEQQMEFLDLPETPGLGMFPNHLIRAKSPFQITNKIFKRKDTIYLFTDSLEDSLRASDTEPWCEELGMEGVFNILNKYHKLNNTSLQNETSQNLEKIVNSLIEEVKIFKGDFKQYFDSDLLILAYQFL